MATQEAVKQSLVKDIRRRTLAPVYARTLIHIQDPHYKFYQVTVDNNKVTTQYGRIGTSGSPTTVTCRDSIAAIYEANKIVDSKLKKGYEELIMTNTAEELPKKPKKPKVLTPEGVEKLNAFLLTLT